MVWFYQTDQWASSNALQYRHRLIMTLMTRDYGHVSVNRLPVNSICSHVGHFVKYQTVSV